MRNIYLSLIFMFLTFSGIAQSNQGGIWFFGAYAGLDFCNQQANGDPTPIMNGQLTTNEGVATIADANCDLLFYTDGIKVWDATHNQMPGTLSPLLGDPSSTQSGVIVPRPLHPNIFYIFAVDDNLGANGLTYSKVDMTLNGGLGDIDPNEKNVPLFSLSTEKITAVAHANGLDIWVITHEWNNNTFRCYLVTAAGGVNTTNFVQTSIGAVHSGNSAWTRGYLKASPSGNKVVVAVEGGGFYELFDFDNATGILSNNVYLSNGYSDCYGVEFSPDEVYLYGSERWGTPLYQFDISLPSAAIQASQTQIATLGTAYGGSLQLAIDQKIYLARSSQKYLGRINDPLAAGLATNYVDQAVLLGPDVATAKQSREGLPTFITSFFVPAQFEVIKSCYSDTTFFVIPNAQGLTSAQWNFNYPNPNPYWNSTSTEDTVWFVYPTGGVYQVELITNRQGVLDTLITPVSVSYQPDAYLGPDKTLCTNATQQYDFSFNDSFAVDGQADYLWTAQIGGYTYYDSSPTYLINKPGTYSLSIYVDSICGASSDVIVIDYNNVEADLGVDITSGLCQGQSQTLNATYTNTNYGQTYYQWSTQANSPTINVTQNGCYSVTLTLGLCQDVDTVCVHFDSPLIAPLGQNKYLCVGTIDTLNALNSGANYLWNTGAQTQFLAVTNPGTYTVTVTNACGSITDNITYTSLAPPAPNLGPDQTICQGVPTAISASTGFPFETYLWSTNQITPQISITNGGYYWVTVTNQCGTGTDQIFIFAEYPLNNFFGSDTAVCSGYILDTEQPNATYFWSSGATTQSIVVTQPGLYAVEVSNNCGTYSDEIELSLITMTQTLPTSATLCEGDILTLDAGNAGSAYFWSTGNMSQTALVNFPGVYSVTVTNACESNAYSVDVALFETTIDLGPDGEICEGNTVILDAGTGHPGANFQWTNGSTSPTFTVNSTGTYGVTVTHTACGTLMDEITIDFKPAPSVSFDQDTIITSASEVLLTPAIVDGSTYLWSTGDVTEDLLVTQSGTYFITVTSANNCTSVAQIVVLLNVGIESYELANKVVLFPNPAKDLLNIKIDGDQMREVSIYSAIGELIDRIRPENELLKYDVSRLSKGIYFVRVENLKGEFVIKPFSLIR